jgi:hypothetical protein
MKLSAIILSIILTVSPMTNYKTLVTKIHEDDQITVLVNYNGRVKENIIHGYDFNIPIKLSEEIPTEATQGKFSEGFEDVDGNIYYQFKSNDDCVWWALTEAEIGFKPSTEKEYILLYSTNGTTAEEKPCDCLPEWECECEVYDDIFLGIFESRDVK